MAVAGSPSPASLELSALHDKLDRVMARLEEQSHVQLQLEAITEQYKVSPGGGNPLGAPSWCWL